MDTNPNGQPERATQNRVIKLFRDELGCRYLGDWTGRDGNSNIEKSLLTAHLLQSGLRPSTDQQGLRCVVPGGR